MKIKLHHNLFLAGCALVVLILCVLSLEAPMRFAQEQQHREQIIRARLLKIRQAELAYRRVHQMYAGTFQQLVQGGFLADTLQFIPFGNGARFDLSATVHTSKSGQLIPLVECGATYDTYLSDLDVNAVANLTEKAYASGVYAGIKLGDIAQNDTQLSIHP